LIYFEVMTTFALIIGWIVAAVFQPGAGMNVDVASLSTQELQSKLSAAQSHPSLIAFILNIIPDTIVGAFARGEILQVLFISVLFGIAMAGLGEANRGIITALEQVSKALMRMIGIIIKLAPLAVFGAMSFTISRFGLVLPAGYTFNLDGSSVYLTMGALFIAQATNTHLTFGQELAVLIFCLVTSKGAATVVGSAFITLAATLASLKTIPVEGMVLILGVDWFMAQARAMTNMVGNGVATIIVAKWENDFDAGRAKLVLDDVLPGPAATVQP